MEKIIYVVRHCEAEGQSPHSKLTTNGKRQATELAKFFDEIEVSRIVSSPFIRARETAWPLAESKGLYIDQDSRLSERVLSSRNFEDWLVKLEDSFLDMHLTYEGGESSLEAMTRVHHVVDEIAGGSKTVLVTHGNLMALLINYFDERFGFPQWQSLTNPDVFLIRGENDDFTIERLWNE